MRLLSICTAALLLPVLLSAQGGEQKPTAQAVYDELSASLEKQATAYKAARKELQDSDAFKAARKARDNDKLRKLLGSLKPPDTVALGQKAIDAAKNFEGDDAVKLLGWAAVKCRDTDMIKSVVATLEKDHIMSLGLIEFLETASVISRPLGKEGADAFLTKVINESPHTMAKAWALYWKSMAAGRSGGDQSSQDLLDQAEKMAEGTWLADKIRGPRFKKERLQIGMVAPNIVGEDIDGVKFELQDYRGKVTVLDFWGFW